MNKTTIIYFITEHELFFLWEHLKNKVYATPPINVDDLRIRITAEVNILKENPDLMKKVMRSMRKRAQVCVNRMAVKSKEEDNKYSCFQ